ncbi:MAG: protein kinase [Polyangiaceae bacterium]
MADAVIEQRARARIGTTLNGKYRVDRLLGVGGMASVYAATHRNNKRVAVKVLHTELSVLEEVRTRFMREGYVANTVEHPGAVAVLDDDVTEDGTAAFLVMELLEGETLAEACDRLGGKLPARAVLAVAYQVLEVLAAADAKGIVHRDIKPSNLFLTRTGHVKVLDFGVARMREVGSELATLSGLALGTPAFMAPEQAMGRSAEIDGLTDLWALGATMFTLATGGPVHPAKSPQEQMVLSATRAARPLGSVVPEVPPDVATIVDRALSFDRAGRWPSAAAMRDAVKQAYRAHYEEDPAPGALVFMASPEKMPVSDRSPMLRSPMASTVPETPVSAHAKRASERPASSPTSLVGTAAQPRTLATGRVRVAVGAVVLVVAGVMLGAWGATKGRGAPPTVATMTTTAIPGATVVPAVAPSAPPTAEAPLATTMASAATTNTVAAATTQPPAPTATPLVVPGRLRPLTVPTAATSSATIAASASPPVDRFDRQ